MDIQYRNKLAIMKLAECIDQIEEVKNSDAKSVHGDQFRTRKELIEEIYNKAE